MAAVYQRNLLTGREGVCRRQNRFLGRGITPTNYGCLQGDGITRDPIGNRAGTNLYSYAGNNPINKVDPMGTQEREPWVVGFEPDEVIRETYNVVGPGEGEEEDDEDEAEDEGESNTNDLLNDLDLLSPGTTGNLITLPTGGSTVDDWYMPVTNALSQVTSPQNVANTQPQTVGEFRWMPIGWSGTLGAGLPGPGIHLEANLGISIPIVGGFPFYFPDFSRSRIFGHRQFGFAVVGGIDGVQGFQTGGAWSQETLSPSLSFDSSERLEAGLGLAPAYGGFSWDQSRSDSGRFSWGFFRARAGGAGGGGFVAGGGGRNVYWATPNIYELMN